VPCTSHIPEPRALREPSPRQNSTGGKSRLGRISKQGNDYIRRLLIIGAQSVLRWSRPGTGKPWAVALLARRPRKVVAVALANKTARIAWPTLVGTVPGMPSRPAVMPTASTGRTHDCKLPIQPTLQIILASAGPSTHDPFSTLRSHSVDAAYFAAFPAMPPQIVTGRAEELGVPGIA
jgi:hypothetical protein